MQSTWLHNCSSEMTTATWVHPSHHCPSASTLVLRLTDIAYFLEGWGAAPRVQSQIQYTCKKHTVPGMLRATHTQVHLTERKIVNVDGVF